MLLTDDEARELAETCPPHKIILDGPQLVALIDSACRVAYQKEDAIVADSEMHECARKLGMMIHKAEKEIGPLVKQLVFLAARKEYGNSNQQQQP